MSEGFESLIVGKTLREAGVLLKQTSNRPAVFQDLQFDTRKVTKTGTLFVVKGDFKADYLTADLLEKISAFVCSQPIHTKKPQWLVSDSQIALASLSAAFFGHPEKELTILGITGTKGKTSSSYMAYVMLDQLTDHQTALFSTIDTIISPELRFKSHLTTPESYELFKNMRLAIEAGDRYLVMEVSSQSYLKKRVFGIHFQVGAFLNISPDHIGVNEHPTFADYIAKKKMLAENSDIFVSNIDDAHGQEFIEHARSFGAKALSISEMHPSDVTFTIQRADLDQSLFTVSHDHKEARYLLDIPGSFNIYNAVTAITMLEAIGFDPSKENAKKALADLQIPGRMVKIKTRSHGLIIVDYAHNGQSVSTLLTFLKSQHQGGRIIIVLGSPGDKGEDRRAQFGQVISEMVDVAYLTTDDPGSENPHVINDQIRAAITNPKVELHEELDRVEAIHLAIDQAGPKDLLLLAAKGDDAFQKTNRIDVPYIGDRKAALQYLAEIEKI